MKIGLICAFEGEGKHVLDNMEIRSEEEALKNSFYTGRFMEHEVVFVTGGIGKVSAALATQVLIDRFEVDLIIFAGVAGGLNSELNIGDTVIATETFYHDVDEAGEGIEEGTSETIFRERFKTDKK